MPLGVGRGSKKPRGLRPGNALGVPGNLKNREKRKKKNRKRKMAQGGGERSFNEPIRGGLRGGYPKTRPGRVVKQWTGRKTKNKK